MKRKYDLSAEDIKKAIAEYVLKDQGDTVHVKNVYLSASEGYDQMDRKTGSYDITASVTVE